jgi:hypothetical protein
MFDKKLKNYLKNWVASVDPPPQGRDQLLSAARKQSHAMGEKQSPKIFKLLRVEFDELFLLRHQNPDLLSSSSRYNLFVIEFGFDPRMSMIIS